MPVMLRSPNLNIARTPSSSLSLSTDLILLSLSLTPKPLKSRADRYLISSRRRRSYSRFSEQTPSPRYRECPSRTALVPTTPNISRPAYPHDPTYRTYRYPNNSPRTTPTQTRAFRCQRQAWEPHQLHTPHTLLAILVSRAEDRPWMTTGRRTRHRLGWDMGKDITRLRSRRLSVRMTRHHHIGLETW